ncbi:MAG: methyltransferase domain-containing protein [Chloroflexota bacterium]
MDKQLVQQQFGRSAAAYATSTVHAKGASLARLVELTRPQPNWRVLDVATAAGHTALAFAPHVAWVVATDLTPAMLPVARRLAQERGLSNMVWNAADAEALPFAPASFDLVTCRIAPHHFPHVERFLAEAARVLRPGGVLAVVDNVVPGAAGVRGRKAKAAALLAGRYVNALEKLRDPSHHDCLSLDEWVNGFAAAGFAVTAQETADKTMAFDDWVERMQVGAADQVRLRVMLRQAPEAAAGFLTPQFSGDRITFRLSEAIVVGQLVNSNW